MKAKLEVSRRIKAPEPSRTRFQIIVAAPKGGVGKSTAIMSLLVCAGMAGLKAIGVNMDEQQTLEKWVHWRSKQRAHADGRDYVDVSVLSASIHDYRHIAGETSDYDLVIYDTPPGHGVAKTAIHRLCEASDMVLIPTSASDVDLDEVIPFRREVVGDRGIFVLNNINRRHKSYDRAKARLLRAGKLCPADIPRLEAIPAHFRLGLATPETNDAGAEAFIALWDFVRHELGIKHFGTDGSAGV